MSAQENEYSLVTFDPGSAAIGWAHFVVNFRAFTRPENKVLRYLQTWDCGEFTGSEFDQLNECVRLIHRARYGVMPYVSHTDVVTSPPLGELQIVSEDFDLTQLIGGSDLLSPVRINAVLDWECQNRFGLRLKLQRRHMRTGVTRKRLKAMGFEGRFRKDEFAAMQHAVTWLRRVKQGANMRPWKLGAGGATNREWDCACARGAKCDLRHS